MQIFALLTNPNQICAQSSPLQRLWVLLAQITALRAIARETEWAQFNLHLDNKSIHKIILSC